MSALTLEDFMTLLEKRHAQDMELLQTQIDANRKAWEAAEAKRTAELNAILEKQTAELEKQTAGLEKQTAEAAKGAAKSEKRMKQLERLTGSLQRDFSDLTEIILRPKMFDKINEYGHKFTMTSPNKEYKDRKGNYITEVDLLLENCDEVMVIEVKSNWKVKYVGELLEKLRLLRKHQAITGMTGKTMYAAISGIKVSPKTRDLALSHGMYVMTMHEDEDRVDVVAPDKKGTW